MAQMPAASSTEADIVAAPAPLKTSSPAKVAAEKAESAPDYSAVMKAMAQAKANRRQVARVVPATAKLRHVAPPVAAGDADEDHWGIQVGAYAQMAKAKQAATAAAHKLGKLVADGEVNVIRAKNGHVGLYRARVIGLPADTAREACRRLAKTHNSCSVVNANLKVASR
jgi:D-alanyl-D-alanine carboxypeptidase